MPVENFPSHSMDSYNRLLNEPLPFGQQWSPNDRVRMDSHQGLYREAAPSSSIDHLITWVTEDKVKDEVSRQAVVSSFKSACAKQYGSEIADFACHGISDLSTFENIQEVQQRGDFYKEIQNRYGSEILRCLARANEKTIHPFSAREMKQLASTTKQLLESLPKNLVTQANASGLIKKSFFLAAFQHYYDSVLESPLEEAINQGDHSAALDRFVQAVTANGIALDEHDVLQLSEMISKLHFRIENLKDSLSMSSQKTQDQAQHITDRLLVNLRTKIVATDEISLPSDDVENFKKTLASIKESDIAKQGNAILKLYQQLFFEIEKFKKRT